MTSKEILKKILNKVFDRIHDDDTGLDDYHRGWNDAMDEAVSIIQEEMEDAEG